MTSKAGSRRKGRRTVTLTIDPTPPDRFLLGLVVGGRRVMVPVPLSSGRHERVLAAIVDVLAQFKLSLGDVTATIVVAGPGRFSNLRVAATIANTLKTAIGTVDFTARKPKALSEDATAYLNELLRIKKPARLVRPRYGRPPSITTPKKR